MRNEKQESWGETKEKVCCVCVCVSSIFCRFFVEICGNILKRI